MDHKLEAQIAATAMDLALHSVEVNPSQATWNEVVVPRAGMIRRWIRTHAYLDKAEVTGLGADRPEFLPTGDAGGSSDPREANGVDATDPREANGVDASRG